ncbi:hypothetical protein VMCG_09128 [Cytospora schulzeri]|uniref:GP-PDE domain-containing protein n=1 Tax=Cytospora schulzeri TaxID=448051 RepID=A0A423VMZ2_9PEZI|nr:hypothetical protein VMCG_09128 [Valsa malicola]
MMNCRLGVYDGYGGRSHIERTHKGRTDNGQGWFNALPYASYNGPRGPRELKEAVARDSRLAETFLDKAYEAVAKHLSILNDDYGITLDSWPPEDLHSIPACEIDDITATLLDICSLLVPLSDYVTTTQRAVERIDSKTSESLYEVERLRKVLQTAATRWVKDLRGINAILQSLRETKFDEKANISLLLSNPHPGGNLQTLEEAVEALQEDSASRLEKCFRDAPICADTPRTQADLFVLTKIGILCSAQQCLPFLLARLSLVQGLSEHASQNPLRLYVLQAERLRKKGLVHLTTWKDINPVLGSLQPRERLDALLCRDGLGRLPLHYAAEYGMTSVCDEMLEHIDPLQDSTAKGESLIFLVPDHLGQTPLSVAITQGKVSTIELFLRRLRAVGAKASQPDVNELRRIFRGLVSLAIRSQCTSTTQTIIDHMPQLLSGCSEVQELLCLASQYGQASIVTKLSTYTTNINIGEKIRGRTPLMLASIYNHTDVVDILLAHPSCDIGVRDYSDWTALDHAAFKGFPHLVRTLQSRRGGGSPVAGAQVMLERDVKYVRQVDPAIHHGRNPNHAYESMKRDCDAGERSHIFVNIGHFDMDREPMILQVDPFRQLVAPAQIPESSLTLQITAIDCDAPTEYWVSFPVLEDLSNEPFYFSAQDPSAAKLRFRLFCSVVGRDNNAQQRSPIGSAIISLSDARHGLGPSMESLMRDHTVSLVSSDATGCEYIGSLTFTFVISKPFSYKGPAPTPFEIVLRRENSTMIAAHRGLGQNKPNQTRLQLGENTLDSFSASLDLGADMLEMYK